MCLQPIRDAGLVVGMFALHIVGHADFLSRMKIVQANAAEFSRKILTRKKRQIEKTVFMQVSKEGKDQAYQPLV